MSLLRQDRPTVQSVQLAMDEIGVGRNFYVIESGDLTVSVRSTGDLLHPFLFAVVSAQSDSSASIYLLDSKKVAVRVSSSSEFYELVRTDGVKSVIIHDLETLEIEASRQQSSGECLT